MSEAYQVHQFDGQLLNDQHVQIVLEDTLNVSQLFLPNISVDLIHEIQLIVRLFIYGKSLYSKIALPGDSLQNIKYKGPLDGISDPIEDQILAKRQSIFFLSCETIIPYLFQRISTFVTNWEASKLAQLQQKSRIAQFRKKIQPKTLGKNLNASNSNENKVETHHGDTTTVHINTNANSKDKNPEKYLEISNIHAKSIGSSTFSNEIKTTHKLTHKDNSYHMQYDENSSNNGQTLDSAHTNYYYSAKNHTKTYKLYEDYALDNRSVDQDNHDQIECKTGQKPKASVIDNRLYQYRTDSQHQSPRAIFNTTLVESFYDSPEGSNSLSTHSDVRKYSLNRSNATLDKLESELQLIASEHLYANHSSHNLNSSEIAPPLNSSNLIRPDMFVNSMSVATPREKFLLFLVRIWGWIKFAIKSANLINFLVFLNRGKYRSLTERITNMQMVYIHSFTPQYSSDELMNHHMQFEMLLEFLTAILPLIDFREINLFYKQRCAPLILKSLDYLEKFSESQNLHLVKQFISFLKIYFSYKKGKNVILTGKPLNQIKEYIRKTKCVFCGTSPITIPFQSKCGHSFCYYCVSISNSDPNTFSDCPACGEKIDEIHWRN